MGFLPIRSIKSIPPIDWLPKAELEAAERYLPIILSFNLYGEKNEFMKERYYLKEQFINIILHYI